MGFLKLLFGALLVGAGGIFLGTAFGVISKDVWPSLVQYWPVLLVAIGAALLAHAIKNIVLGWIAAMVVIGGLLLGAWWFTTHQPKGGASAAVTTIDLAKPPVESVTIRMRSLLGRFEVRGESGTDHALRLEALHVPEKMKSAHYWRVAGRAGILEWPGASAAGGIPPLGGEIHLVAPERLPVRLELKSHLSTAEVDLHAVRSERATFEVMGSSIRVIASDLGQPQRIRVRGILSHVRIRLPANAPARVVYSSWFGLRSMPRDFVEHMQGRGKDQIFVSEGRGGSILIEVDGPLNRVEIERTPAKAVERAALPHPAIARACPSAPSPFRS
jgi:hypothetical protein